jgi:hypothetical protein
LISVLAGVFLLGLNSVAAEQGEPASGPKERVLAKPLFNHARAAQGDLLVIDRRLFRQLKVAKNADVVPSAAVRRSESKRIAQETGFASALQQYEKDSERRQRERNDEKARQQSAIARALHERGCDKQTANQVECRAEVNHLASLGALPSPANHAGTMGAYEGHLGGLGAYCGIQGGCGAYTY